MVLPSSQRVRDALDDLDVLQQWLPMLEETNTRYGLEADYAEDLRELLIQNHSLVNQYVDWFDTYEHYEGFR